MKTMYPARPHLFFLILRVCKIKKKNLFSSGFFLPIRQIVLPPLHAPLSHSEPKSNGCRQLDSHWMQLDHQRSQNRRESGGPTKVDVKCTSPFGWYIQFFPPLYKIISKTNLISPNQLFHVFTCDSGIRRNSPLSTACIARAAISPQRMYHWDLTMGSMISLERLKNNSFLINSLLRMRMKPAYWNNHLVVFLSAI